MLNIDNSIIIKVKDSENVTISNVGNSSENKRDGNTEPKIKILFCGVNPVDTPRVRIDKEYREIVSTLERSKNRDTFELHQAWALRTGDLQEKILKTKPTIVHFSGHGDTNGITLEDDSGASKTVSNEALEGLFSGCSEYLECVILNSCYSSSQAELISKNIPYVIGTKSALPDNTAIAFATGFYTALGAGNNIKSAYEAGINRIQLGGIKGDNIPELLSKDQSI